MSDESKPYLEDLGTLLESRREKRVKALVEARTNQDIKEFRGDLIDQRISSSNLFGIAVFLTASTSFFAGLGKLTLLTAGMILGPVFAIFLYKVVFRILSIRSLEIWKAKLRHQYAQEFENAPPDPLDLIDVIRDTLLPKIRQDQVKDGKNLPMLKSLEKKFEDKLSTLEREIQDRKKEGSLKELEDLLEEALSTVQKARLEVDDWNEL